MKTRIALFAAAACLAIGVAPAMAQGFGGPPESTQLEDQSKMPKELFVLPPVSKSYQPKKTAWGDPDLRGMWPIDAIGGLDEAIAEARRLAHVAPGEKIELLEFRRPRPGLVERLASMAVRDLFESVRVPEAGAIDLRADVDIDE